MAPTERSIPDLPFADQVCLQLLLQYYSHRYAKLCGEITYNAPINTWLTHLKASVSG